MLLIESQVTMNKCHNGNFYESFWSAVLICSALITLYASSHGLMNNQL